MDEKTRNIVLIAATTLLCGLPGLCSLCFGSISAAVSFMPNADIDILGSSDPASAMGMGIGVLCGGLIMIAIPIVTAFLTLRKKGDEPAVVEDDFADDPFGSMDE